MSAERVAVTGYGAVTPLGVDAPSTWSGLLDGLSGVNTIPDDWAEDLPVRFAGSVPPLSDLQLSSREARRLDRAQQFAIVAGREAWERACRPDVDKERLGVVVGTAFGGLGTILAQERELSDHGFRRVSPHTVTMMLGNGSAAWLSIEIGARAGAQTPLSACASGSEAVARARDMILAGNADVVLAGGTEAPLSGLAVAAFAQMRTLSTRNSDPSKASRPFDAERDGFVLGEGAAMLTLERESHARSRGAHIYAYVEGAAVTADADDIVGANPENQARTIVSALRDADVAPEDVGFVHAHATSTRIGDLNESIAIAKSGISAPITSLKSMTGHLLGAAGALGALAAVLGVHEGVVTPTINVDQVDPAIDLDIVQHVKRMIATDAVLVNSYGFGGHNAALVITRT